MVNVLLILLAAEPELQVALTSGAQVNGSAVGREVVPLVALEVHGSGEFSSRVAVQVDGRGLHDLGSFLDFTHRWSERLSLGVRLEPLTPSLHLVSFDWANAIAAQPVDTTFPTPVLSSTVVTGPVVSFISVRGGVMGALTPFVDVVGGATATIEQLTFGVRAARITTIAPPFSTLAGPSLWMWVFTSFVEASWGGGVPAPLDLVTTGADPRRYGALGEVEPRRGFGLTLRAEGGAGSNVLVSGNRIGELEGVPVGYADVQARARVGSVQLFVIGRLATFSLLIVSPSAARTLSIRSPGSFTTEAPMLTGMAGVEASFGRLRPGFMVRARELAMRSIAPFFGGNAPPPTVVGLLRVVADPSGARTVMALPSPLLAGKVFVRWSPEPHVTLAAEVDLEVDRNQYFVGGVPVPQREVELRAQVLLQARL